METLDQNGECGRVKKKRRLTGARVLIRPQTWKAIVAVGRWIVKILQLIEAVTRVFRH